MTNINIVPASPDLLQKFYGKPISRTLRAVVAEREGEILGVGGVCIINARAVVFTDLTDDLRKNKRALIRGIREVKRLAKLNRLPVYAVADTKIPGYETLLEHAGFVHEYEGVYVWQQ